jgi:hypothetical protein
MLTLSFVSHAAPSHAGRKNGIKSMEVNVGAEALARKARSHARLSLEGVPINRNLPVIEDAAEAKHRSKEEVAWRAMALLLVAVKGEGQEQSTVIEVVEDYGLGTTLYPSRKGVHLRSSANRISAHPVAWRYEAAWVLLWSLGYV